MSVKALELQMRKDAQEILGDGFALSLVIPNKEIASGLSLGKLDIQNDRILPHRDWTEQPNRRKSEESNDWLSSRYALAAALQSLTDRSMHLCASISHTKGLAAAFAAYRRGGLVGVGIDIERRDRALSPKLQAWLRNHAASNAYEPIETWCGFEAMYKADSSRSKVSFSEYRPYEPKIYRKNDLEFKTLLARSAEWVGAISVAFLRSN